MLKENHTAREERKGEPFKDEIQSLTTFTPFIITSI